MKNWSSWEKNNMENQIRLKINWLLSSQKHSTYQRTQNVLKETTDGSLSKLIEHENNISYITTSFGEHIE